MAEFPALPLFTDAYLADTRHLTAAQHGAYLLLLMMAWRTPDCALPNDHKILARWAGVDGRAWAAMRDVVLDFWQLVDVDGVQKFRQGRLLSERIFADAVKARQAAAGRASALKRNKTRATGVQPRGNHFSTPSPSPSPTLDISNDISTPIPPKLPEKKNGRSKPKRNIPTDWQPDASCVEACASRGFNLEFERAEFIDYWLSRGDARADWNATFRNWMRTKKSPGKPIQPNQPAGNGATSYERGLMASLARAQDPDYGNEI